MSYQRNAAMEAVRALTGVLGLTNEIILKPKVMSANAPVAIGGYSKGRAFLPSERDSGASTPPASASRDAVSID
ncbi:hypothetical protein WDL1CHR_05471 [Variovorax sp. WDL1]|nr:hypothetical protein [Variovorax sp. WDL1]PNG47148.1 hypothetical protein CHC06_07496 [Variovorax sp. B2]PNG48201.1 hypothetical protein CHC07_07372 [Variovorax sp. B4]VTV15019.1 hypothetical protein WDL1CHR_05471 [Variovorax sp. WDL1]